MLAMREPLRQRKKARTARTIEQVATDLFERQGYDATTLEQIAEAAEVHKQTVLRYFKSKEDIAFAYRNQIYANFVEALANRTGTVLEYWREYIVEHAQTAMRKGALRRWVKFIDSDDRLFAYQLHLNQRYIDTLADALSEEAGVDPRADVFARSVAAMLTAANYDVSRMAIRSGRDKLIAQYCIEVVDLAETLRRDALATHDAVDNTKPAAPAAKKRASPAKPAAPKAEGPRARSPKTAPVSGETAAKAVKKILGRKRDL
jgi:AcrR family transcriptional regulator